MVEILRREIAFASINVIILAIFYTLFGVLLSFVLHYLFEECNDKWKSRSTVYQLTDVSTEISMLALISFWVSHIIELAPPVFPVRKSVDILVDQYVSGIFFIFAVFVFMEDLTSKLKYIVKKNLGKHFEKMFPTQSFISKLFFS